MFLRQWKCQYKKLMNLSKIDKEEKEDDDSKLVRKQRSFKVIWNMYWNVDGNRENLNLKKLDSFPTI